MVENKTYYTTDTPFYINTFIREYDISKANINILYNKNLITKELYDHLYNSSREYRQVTIGRMIKKNKKIKDIISKGIAEFRNKLIQMNHINDDDIISIKNDAIFVKGKKLLITDFGNVKFVEKGLYTSFYKINGLEFYYYYNAVTNEEYLTIKGMKEKAYNLHKEYFIDFLLVIFNMAQTNNASNILEIIHDFYIKYINKELPIGYYRRFDSESFYDIYLESKFSEYRVSAAGNINTINIAYNAYIINEFYKLFNLIYFNHL